jgi:hypothetical protein
MGTRTADSIMRSLRPGIYDGGMEYGVEEGG